MFVRKPVNKTSLAMRKTLHGVGINDSWYITQPKKGGHCPIYRKWHDMITRCHSEKFHIKHPTYADCSVCPEWFSFSNFLSWHEKNHVEGWELDKDLKVKGNKVYSPETCLFVPSSINRLFGGNTSTNKGLPIGVSFHTPTGKYRARIALESKSVYLGLFSNVDKALDRYNQEKNKEIKRSIKRYPQLKEVLAQYLCDNINLNK